MKYSNDLFLIDYDIFMSWIEKHYGDDYHQSGEEIKINSIFTEDKKYHLWCNPRKNAFHCWKSDKGGSLVDLVAEVEGIPYKSALSILGLGNSIRHYEMELLQLFKKPKEKKDDKIPTMTLPSHTYLISELSDLNPYKKIAIQYLSDRHIPIDTFFACIDGKYRNRIIIPYYSKSGELQYWNGRDWTDKHLLRYWGPTRKECGVGKEDFVYFYKWPIKDNEIVYLTEGEFDAVSLNMCGLYGAAIGGKSVNEKHVKILSQYKICVAFDNDQSGKDALYKFGMNMLKDGQRINFVRPPIGYKDWNALLKKMGPSCIIEYINLNTSVFDEWTIFKSEV